MSVKNATLGPEKNDTTWIWIQKQTQSSNECNAIKYVQIHLICQIFHFLEQNVIDGDLFG